MPCTLGIENALGKVYGRTGRGEKSTDDIKSQGSRGERKFRDVYSKYTRVEECKMNCGGGEKASLFFGENFFLFFFCCLFSLSLQICPCVERE